MDFPRCGRPFRRGPAVNDDGDARTARETACLPRRAKAATVNPLPAGSPWSLPNAVIFDCDGVLVDSEVLSCGAWLPVLARRGVRAKLSDIQAFIGKSDRAVLAHFEEQEGRPLGSETIAEREREYFHSAAPALASFPGTRAALEELRRRGMAMAVASSGSPKKIDFNLRHAGLDDLLPIRCSTLEVAHGKPAPDVFLLAAARLGAQPPRTIVVEDSLPGLEAARQAGMLGIGFCSSHSGPELVEAGAVALFDDFGDLLQILESLLRAHAG